MACNRCSVHTETRNRKNSDNTNHRTIPVRKGTTGTGLGVKRMTASSMASSTIKIRMRTFTSQVSQLRSSEMEYMNFGSQPSVLSHSPLALGNGGSLRADG